MISINVYQLFPMNRILQFVFLCVMLLMASASLLSAKTGVLSERNYKKLQSIHKLIEKQKLSQATAQLENFLSTKHNAYTQAIFLQTAAHIAIEKEQYHQAIKYLEQVNSLNALPHFVSLNIQYNLAQLYAQNEQLNNSIKILQLWLKASKKVTSEQHIFAATLFSLKNQHQTAIKHIQQAIKKASKPKESWYQMLIAQYVQQKQYLLAIKVYQKLIKWYPENKNYWKQLSGLYFQTDQMHQALAILILAEKRSLLSTEQELLRLVNLYLYADIPLKAAQLLAKKLNTGAIQSNLENKMKLVNSWILAQEYSMGIEVLQQLSLEDHNNGQYSFLIARLLMEQGQWQTAYQYFNAAQNKKLDDPGNNYLLQGISAYYAKMPEQAKKAFKKAEKYSNYKDKANDWLKQLE